MARKMKKNTSATEAKQPKCPGCGGPLSYNVEKGTLTCSYCGSQVNLGVWQDNRISGFDFQDEESHRLQENAEDIPVYNCVSCGAEILAAREEVSLTCPYCSNNIILTDKISGKLRPNAVVPFKVTPDHLSEALNKFYKDKTLLPKDYFSQSKLGKVTGLYVPCWSFSGDISGDMAYTGDIQSDTRDGDEIVTSIQEYKLLRKANVSFEHLILDASRKMDDASMDSIMPFDLSEAKPFNMAYLAGFAADRFDVQSEALSARAEERMRNSANRAVLSKVKSEKYSNITQVGSALSAKMKKVQYLLLPVYVFDIKYKGKKYHYIMNGQTGKVVGNVPTSKETCRKYQGIRAAIAFAVIMLLSVITYFLGV